MNTVGLDIGGTKILGALVDDEGEVLAEGRVSTPSTGTRDIIAGAADLVRDLAAHGEVSAVGMACAGFLDRARTRMMFAPNLPWQDEPLKALMEEATGLPVVLENDANAATWGEYVQGSAGEARDLIFITIGTGVGGGVITDGRLLVGAFGMGGELGHMRVVPQGRPCGCGVSGCLEQYASGSALLRAAREKVVAGGDRAAALVELCGGDAERLEGRHVTEAAAAGDALSRELLAELGRWIGEGAASVAAILDPEVVLIGGGVSAAGGLLLDPAREAFESHLTGVGHRPVPVMKLAELRDQAGVVGAAALAREAAR